MAFRRLSSPISELKAHYEFVVVGSGYGGGIAASRLARAGRKVCLLERGREIIPGEYPDTGDEVLAQTQMDSKLGHKGSRTGMFDLRFNQEVNVLIGCGLGGTSLINANVSIEPEERVFQDPAWPPEFNGGNDPLLNQGYTLARDMLKPVPCQAPPELLKTEALRKSAHSMQADFKMPDINVTFHDHVNHVGVEQKKCERCGDCMTGCNYSAKNTVLMNYLPDAKNHGAHIFTKVSVRSIARNPNGTWTVYYQVLESGREAFNAPPIPVTANYVVLAAGTLGTTEILLRSRDAGLTVSRQLGQNFTGNGDVLGFGYNCDQPVNAIGFGHRNPEGRKPVGPCITGLIDLRKTLALQDAMIIEEGSFAGGFSDFLPLGLRAAAKVAGKDTDTGLIDQLQEEGRVWDSLIRGAYHGATRNTQVYLVMAHDNGKGSMSLENDRLRISWPKVGEQAIFGKINDRLIAATKALGGTFVKNPMWSKEFGHDLITVHPLGGCIMAATAEKGVVNHKGQVFSGEGGADVYDTLFVSDGSIIPRSLGVNPLLTISALAERTWALLAEEKNWELKYDFDPAPAPQPSPSPPVGIQFTETMHGNFSPQVKDDYQKGADLGKQQNCTLRFVLTLTTDDVKQAMADPNRKFSAFGTVAAPALSPEPLSVNDSEFYLFPADPSLPNTRNMIYRLRMNSVEGKCYFLEGIKLVHDGPGFDAWEDTTTLFITVFNGPDRKAPVLGKGILRLTPEDFSRQMTTMQVLHASGIAERIKILAAFGNHFAGVLFNTYGGVFAKPNEFDPDAPPRKKRPLRLPAPQIHTVQTSDRVELRLTRYHQGKKGPVLLSHGLGVSSLIFSIDTIDTNLTEFLFANGYDVWLLDYRSSIALPSATTHYTADDVATLDYPAAVARVLSITGAPSVQMVVHCFGSTTFFMAMLAGLKGVRSAVCSQIATHIEAPAATKLKTGLHMPQFLEALGIQNLTAYTDKNAKWWDQLANQALKLYPVGERCSSPVCHRITFLYAPLYEHDQLNTATHDALHEMFGVASIDAFKHLGVLVNHRELRDAGGQNVYMPHLQRLALPIAFLHGAENECFLPKSTALTYDLLRETNGKQWYTRYLIPQYGHIDCIFGKDASRDVYPLALKHLNATQ